MKNDLSWKGWSFADKKRPSPWLTFLAVRTHSRQHMSHSRGTLAMRRVQRRD